MRVCQTEQKKSPPASWKTIEVDRWISPWGEFQSLGTMTKKAISHVAAHLASDSRSIWSRASKDNYIGWVGSYGRSQSFRFPFQVSTTNPQFTLHAEGPSSPRNFILRISVGCSGRGIGRKVPLLWLQSKDIKYKTVNTEDISFGMSLIPEFWSKVKTGEV